MPDVTRYQGFFGAPGAVARQLFALPQLVVRGGYFALLLESKGQADVRVFTRAELADERGEVRDWSGETLGDLPERLMRACWAAPGDRRGAIDAIESLGSYSVQTGIPCPPTARGAFGHQLRRHEPAAEIRAYVIS